jgi:hypothetical protein
MGGTMTKTCPICNKVFATKNERRLYCSDTCKARAFALRNPNRRREIERRYWANHPLKRRLKDVRYRLRKLQEDPNYYAEKSKKMREKVRKYWGSLATGQRLDLHPVAVKAEEYACQM